MKGKILVRVRVFTIMNGERELVADIFMPGFYKEFFHSEWNLKAHIIGPIYNAFRVMYEGAEKVEVECRGETWTRSDYDKTVKWDKRPLEKV